MQHAGLQYGQGAANSHQSPPFAHADISFSKQQNTNGGNTTSSLRQFRKKDGLDKNSGTDLNPSIGENSHIARVAPHSHYPPRPNDYYRYQSQYPDYNSSYKEPIAQVKYSEIAETPPQAIQHVDHIPSALQKHKEPHKDFMEMCNIAQQTHMKQNYPDNLTRQQSYPPDAASMHHQYLHKETQVHPNYKPESQYQQYPQLAKYNMPSQCRKYPPPPPPHENDFLTKLQRLNPSIARSIMSDHHIRESQTNTYPNQMYPQNQRYYPTHLQNNPTYNYHVPQPYNYPSSCNYKHPDYSRPNQMAVGGSQYPNPDRSLSPRNLHMSMNYAATPQKISPNSYGQYNPPEYAQHYQHRRASVPQEYYQQSPCRSNPYVPAHQISPEPNDNRASSGLRHFIENWAEEEATQEIAPIYKENIRVHGETGNEQVFVINSSDIPQCLENVALVPTENGQYIIKSGALDNSVVRIKETTENNGERTVNLQIVEASQKPDCMLAGQPVESDKSNEEPITVPYLENQIAKDCDEDTTKPTQIEKAVNDASDTVTPEEAQKNDKEASVIVCNEVSVIKDMPLIEEDQEKTSARREDEIGEETMEASEASQVQENDAGNETSHDDDMVKEETELQFDNHVTTTTRRTQRIFSVDDIINNIGNSSGQQRRSSLQLTESYEDDVQEKESKDKRASTTEDQPPPPGEGEEEEEMEYASAISIEDDSVILEIGGALVQLNINHFNGTKVLSVLPLSDSLVIDVNGNYQNCEEINMSEGAEENEMVNEGKEVAKGETIETSSKDKIGTCGEDKIEIYGEDKVSTFSNEKVETSNDDKIETSCGEQIQDKTETSSERKIESIEQQEQEHQQIEEDISTSECQSEVVIGEESIDNDVFIELNSNNEEKAEDKIEEPKEENKGKETVEEMTELDEKKPKPIEPFKRKEKRPSSLEEKKKCKENEDDKKKTSSSKKVKTDLERKQSEERAKTKKVLHKTDEDEPKTVQKGKTEEDDNKTIKKKVEERPKEEEAKKEETVKKEDRTEKPSCVSTKAAKKLYLSDCPTRKPSKEKETKSKIDDKSNKPKIDVKKSMELEETVNKIKSLKEKASKKENKPKESPDVSEKKSKSVKKVTFSLETEIREMAKDDVDKKKLSLEEYNSRKRKSPTDIKEEKIMENTVTSSEDINDRVVEEVEQSIENAIKDSTLKKMSPKTTNNSWEDDADSPKASDQNEVMSKINRCIIDVNEFNIKPIESVSTPSPVSSSQFSYHSEDDSLQVYKEVVDSKLNSLNIKIPKVSKPKPIDKVSALLERFLNKSTLNGNELEKVKKIIEFKRKIEEKQLTYEVRGERDYKDLKLHFKKVPEKRPKKRFRNLYAEDTTSDDSDSSRSDKTVGDYSVYQRNSHQGVPKLIFKRNSGLPQPFVKLERSQAVELLAKKRKLY